jgi:transcriptional regulator with XRE-family HTH domain
MADYRQRLAERLEHERTKKSLSQDTLALRAGVSAKTIKRIEEQKVDNPRPVTIRRISEALDIEPDELRPPPELEQDQLNRIERHLERIAEALGLSPIENPGDAEQLERDEEEVARRYETSEPPSEGQGHAGASR